MKLFRYLLLKEFLPFLLMGVLFFALILVLGDVFSNLWRYLNKEVPFGQALKVSLLFAPKAISYALPIGAMFASAFALGNLGARNELIAVFGSGVPLHRFVLPIIFLAALLSVGEFFLEDRAAIKFLKQRDELSRELLGSQSNQNRSRAVAISQRGKVIYYANYYNHKKNEFTDLVVIILNEKGEFLKRIDAEAAIWNSDSWTMQSCRVFSINPDGSVMQEQFQNYQNQLVNEPPDTFRLDTRDIEEMTNREARIWIATQKRAGLPYKKMQSEYYQRFPMAMTPFLVVLFAGALGGRFRRNILLISLLGSLGLSVAWYISRMIANLLAGSGMISPLAGAVVPYSLFLLLGVWLFRNART